MSKAKGITMNREDELRKQITKAIDLFQVFNAEISVSVEDSSKSPGRIRFKNGSVHLENFNVEGPVDCSSMYTQLYSFHIQDLRVIADLLPFLYEECEKKHAILVAQEEEQNKYLDESINKLRDFVNANSPKAAYKMDEEAAERLRKIIEGKDVPRIQDTPFIPPHWPNPNNIYILVDER